jgi:hypothetical protein
MTKKTLKPETPALTKPEVAEEAEAAAIKAVEEAALKQAKAAGLDAKAAAKVAKEEGERKCGKLAARRQLLATTRKVRMIRDAPTSKGRLLTGAVARLPNHEADRLKKALPPLIAEL